MKWIAWPVLLPGLVLVGPGTFAQEPVPVSSITSATWSEYSGEYARSALCGEDEITLWTCERRKRTYSLCSSRAVTRNAGYIQYRASERGRITFVYPASRKPPLGSFTYQSFANGDASVDFENGGFRYSVLDPLRGNSSILVTGPGDSGATVEIPCNGGNQTLQVNYTMRLMHDSGAWSGQ